MMGTAQRRCKWPTPTKYQEIALSSRLVCNIVASRLTPLLTDHNADMDRPCAKVFSMPELMENILLMVADAAVDGANASSTPRLEPIQTLTGLPRVSSDFFQAMKTTKLARSIRSWQHENQEVVADRGKFMQICQLVGVENEYNTIAAINYSTAPRLDLTFSPGPKVEAKHARCPVFWLFQHLIEKKNPQYRIDADAGSTGILSGGISSGGTHTAPLYPPVLAAYYTANSPEDDDDEEEDEEDKIRVDPMPGTLAITIPKFYLNTNSLQGPTRMLNTFLKSNMAGEKATWRNIQAVNGDKLTISFDNVSARYDGSSKRKYLHKDASTKMPLSQV